MTKKKKRHPALRVTLTATCEHCGGAVTAEAESQPGDGARVGMPATPLWTINLSPPSEEFTTFGVLACEPCARKLGGPPFVEALERVAAARVKADEEAAARKRLAEAEAEERAEARARLRADLAEVEKRLAPIRAELATLGRSSAASPIGVDPATIRAADDRRQELEKERDRLVDETIRIRQHIERNVTT